MSSAFYIVDGHAAAYRAFYALRGRSSMNAPDGSPTGAVFIFTKMLLSLLQKCSPDHVACVFDPKGPTHRSIVFEQYKANRKPMPDELKAQLPLMFDIVHGYRIPVFQVEGYEADDVMATLAVQARRQGCTVFLVTGDKDLMQLVDGDSVFAYDTRTESVVGPDDVRAKFGVGPELMGDLLALMGDTSDNIPGVPGVGPKKASQLLHRFGSLDAVIEHASEIDGRLGETIRANVDAARRSRELVTLHESVPGVAFDAAASSSSPPDSSLLIPLFRRLGFRELLSSLPVDSSDREGYSVVSSLDEFERLLSAARSARRFAFDLETTSASPVDADIVGFSFSFEPGNAFYVPVLGPETRRLLPLDSVLALLRPALADPAVLKIGQNAKYDIEVLASAGLEVAPPLFDTMLAAYILDPGAHSFGLDGLSLTYLAEKKISTADVLGRGRSRSTMDEISVSVVGEYAAEDADCTFRLAGALEPLLSEHGHTALFNDLEMPLVPVLARMELAGVRIDTAYLERLEKDFDAQISSLEADIQKAAGVFFSPASPKQLADVLFRHLGLPVIRKGKTGPSTDSEVLEQLSDRHPLPSLVLEYRALAKLKNTYVDTLPAMVSTRTGRLHTSFNQTGTATGRLSSSDPNLQNIPVRTPLGRSIRRAFIPADGFLFLSADYSQVELRMLAHLCSDPNLSGAFSRGEDIHRSVAAEILGKSPSDVTSDDRRLAKAVNFGLVYGQGARGLSHQTGLSLQQASDFIDRYFERFPGVKSFIDGLVSQAEKDGFVQTVSGRRRFLPDLSSDHPARHNAAARAAVNTVIQGSAADLIKLAMISLDRELLSRRLRSRMLLQIHDELLLEVPADEMNVVRPLLVDLMQNAMRLSVPLLVESAAGHNWMDLK